MRTIYAVMTLTAAACAAPVADADAIYFDWDDERVLCGIGVDSDTIELADLEIGMERARDRGEVLSLYAHQPGGTIDVARLDAILATAERVGLPFVTFPELGERTTATPGLAFGFDDAYVDEWYGIRDLLAAHGARVTFFVSNFGQLTAVQRDQLHQLADAGHAIEAHGMGHRDAPAYVNEHGLAAYLEDEIDPLLDVMAADGFYPTTFAYPFGNRTPELDTALLERFRLIRSLTYLDHGVLHPSPCPR